MYIINFVKANQATTFSRFGFFCTLLLLFVTVGCSSSSEDKQKNNDTLLSTQHLTKTIIPIEGMTCNACVGSVKRKLKSLEGLGKVEVSLEHRNATIFFEKGKITPQQIQAAINEVGYKAGEPLTEDKSQ